MLKHGHFLQREPTPCRQMPLLAYFRSSPGRPENSAMATPRRRKGAALGTHTHMNDTTSLSLSIYIYIYIDMHVHVHIMQTIVVILLFIICKRILYSYNDVSEKGSGALRIEAHTARFQFGADVVIQVLFYRLPFLIRRVMRKEHNLN